jgi:hypothetical protein
MSTCQALVPVTWPGRVIWVICGDSTSAEYECCCVHEHVRRGFLCATHEPVPGNEGGCKTCWELGHECLMAFRLVT